MERKRRKKKQLRHSQLYIFNTSPGRNHSNNGLEQGKNESAVVACLSSPALLNLTSGQIPLSGGCSKGWRKKERRRRKKVKD